MQIRTFPNTRRRVNIYWHVFFPSPPPTPRQVNGVNSPLSLEIPVCSLSKWLLMPLWLTVSYRFCLNLLYFFPKACSVLFRIFIWILFHWRYYQTYILFARSLTGSLPSSALSDKCPCARTALWLWVSHRCFPSQKLWEGSETANCKEVLLPHSAGHPRCTRGKGRFPSRYRYQDTETFCIRGFLSTHSWPCLNGC